jgi:hypothetical protein
MVISLISLAYVEEDGLLLSVGFLAAIGTSGTNSPYAPGSAGLDLRLLPRALPHILCGDEYSCLLWLALL